MSEPFLLTAKGLHKTYGRGEAVVRAVNGIDIDLSSGEMVAIMGSSGSGKTTLLHLLSGLTRTDTGSIQCAGQELTKLSDRMLTSIRGKQIGVVFQSYKLMPTLSVLDNVALPLMLAGTSPSAARTVARQRLDSVEISHQASQRPARLSGGEQQRVAIARALVTEPSIVMADEPTGNLDRENSQIVCQLLRQLAQGQRAVLIVTHDPVVAWHADRIIVLSDGTVADSFGRNETDSVEALAARCFRSAQLKRVKS
ncbi:MAG: ABC transporter ATP-binding protein [Gemmatales bacterium]